MKPAPLRLLRPETLDQALAALAELGEAARPLAGGQTLMPMLNLRVATPAVLVDLNRIASLAELRLEPGWLRLGAMARQRSLLEHPLVAAHAPLLPLMLRHVGHAQTRNRGTLGGSLAHADPAAELPLAMLALDAVMTVQHHTGPRDIPARDFFRGALTTALAPGELLVEVALPVAPLGTRTAFREVARRHGDFAIVAVAAQADARGVTAAIGGLADRPLATTAPNLAALRPAMTTLLASAEALDDLQASADYRRHLAGVLLEDCLAELAA
jgi:CO/xanthine dehydrogenase FAD-binding subunit